MSPREDVLAVVVGSYAIGFKERLVQIRFQADWINPERPISGPKRCMHLPRVEGNPT